MKKSRLINIKSISILSIVIILCMFFITYIAKGHINLNKKVSLGIDNIDENINIFKDKKVGLITNPSGINSDFISTIDILNEKTNLTTLFAVEHGIRGDVNAGDNVKDEIDEITKVPVHSLYGKLKKPTSDMLKNIDILAYDIQDVGLRFYTYINTLAYVMEACAENNKTCVVFDRPNPLGGKEVEGICLNKEVSSFVGKYPIVQRYGLTIGEYANFINKEFNINCDLKVIPMTNWNRDMYYDETNLKTWVMPSPNIPTVDSAIAYAGTCLFEGTNVSEGRGTTKPFEIIGAPWIDSSKLANNLNNLNLGGVKFRPISFKPTCSKYSEENTLGKHKFCGGVQIHIIDRKNFNPIKTGVAMIITIRNMYKDEFKFTSNNFIDNLYGDNCLREQDKNIEEIFEKIDKESKEFKEKIKNYYIY
ncbi:MAG: exo-beta-N-acetylmuramidase NamZ family protein [Sarcina sp.]